MRSTHIHLSVFLLFSLPLYCLSTTYYVSPNGLNGNPGTMTDPLFLIQDAIHLCSSGKDTIYLMEGTYWQRLSIIDKKGIYLSSIDATNKSTVSGSGVAGATQIYIQDSDSISIANLILRENVEQEANGIYVVGEGDGIFISDNEMYNIGWGTDPSLDPESFTPVRQAHGILINGRSETGYRNVYIGRNVLHDLIVGNSEAITLTGNVFDFLIEDNTLYNITNIGIDIAGHYAWAFPDSLDQEFNQARDGRIQRNTIYNCQRPTNGNEPAGIYVDGGEDVFIDRNISRNNGVGISLGCENADESAENIIVVNNLIYNNDKFGMVFGANAGDVEGSTVRNNTFFNNGIFEDNSGSISLQKSTDGVLRNNLIYLLSDDYFGLSMFGFLVNNLVMDHNLFYNTDGNTPRVFAYNPATGSTDSIESLNFADPLLVSSDSANPDFHLMQASPAIDAGSDQLSLIPNETDIDGTLRVAADIDIGADEWEDPAGIAELSSWPLTLYPNPTSAILSATTAIAGLQYLSVYDGSGRCLLSVPAQDLFRIEVNLQDLPAGMYVIRIDHRTERAMFRRVLKK
ncbi:MAG: right-handed parallel beta-helix repeat-containing protein [Bacteroidota bacterium]